MKFPFLNLGSSILSGGMYLYNNKSYILLFILASLTVRYYFKKRNNKANPKKIDNKKNAYLNSFYD